jgi:hypothetical protein
LGNGNNYCSQKIKKVFLYANEKCNVDGRWPIHTVF